MEYRTLGKTGLQISALSFGAGPVSTLMVSDDVNSSVISSVCDRAGSQLV